MKIDLPHFDRGCVLVAGDLMLDRYWHGDTSRISPEAPVPVVAISEAEERAGGAGNVALNIAALRGRAIITGLAGEDEAASMLSQRLEHAGIECHIARLPGFTTITKLRVLSRHQQLLRLDFEQDFSGADTSGFRRHFAALAACANVIVLSDYGKGTLAGVDALIAVARALGKPVLIDPKGRDFTRYRGATLITPNQSEFEDIVGHCRSDAELVEKGERLRADLDLEALLVTRSGRGMTLIRAGMEALHLPARAREVFDVTGAGDTVIAVLASALAAGAALEQATALANMAAGIVVGKLGAASASQEELLIAMHEHERIDSGVVDEETLMRRIAHARARGERIVMTNGCFDILHAGHVAYLEQARALGDRLIVAVNDDESVRRLKGEARPVVALQDRMALLAGLQAVDWVVPFSEDTPKRLICRALPDVLVKGGDYKPEDIAGGDCVTANGGRIAVLDFLPGRSTSGIIDAIRK
ncbi:MAG: bifunctional D-glycero-beta-D-manno-heptose-7-phosphate kinase/D-glycero-beta-D-manno-heptose 1-phosphate adenylyltransferase HldE [Chromatiales bacterium]|jgi:D-beta-D-heptose 7-phosphate kinase/D-beta-D-heptose 1-phosphate adenosyltransferase|nr:bifunctional D-glycero-beta-D-manno-heptose-7-phosphate kinase/D-glycero-beta-D-manno-heptose 1-phosphate adenylyltransferase HldE [Chromatiales bacterium]